jgi:hypothetical protein
VQAMQEGELARMPRRPISTDVLLQQGEFPTRNIRVLTRERECPNAHSNL